MDRQVVTSVLGTIGTFTLEGIHLILASTCAILTALHAVYSIYLKFKDRGK